MSTELNGDRPVRLLRFPFLWGNSSCLRLCYILNEVNFFLLIHVALDTSCNCCFILTRRNTCFMSNFVLGPREPSSKEVQDDTKGFARLWYLGFTALCRH